MTVLLALDFAQGPVVRVARPMLLRDRGVGIPDDVRQPADLHRRALRAVADHIELGHWTDAVAWAALAEPTVTREWRDLPDLALFDA